MSAPTPAGPEPEGPGLQPPDFGRPSPALLAHAIPTAPDDSTGGHDDTARQR